MEDLEKFAKMLLGKRVVNVLISDPFVYVEFDDGSALPLNRTAGLMSAEDLAEYAQGLMEMRKAFGNVIPVKWLIAKE